MTGMNSIFDCVLPAGVCLASQRAVPSSSVRAGTGTFASAKVLPDNCMAGAHTSHLAGVGRQAAAAAGKGVLLSVPGASRGRLKHAGHDLPPACIVVCYDVLNTYDITSQNTSKLWSREQHARSKLRHDTAAFTTCGKLGNGPLPLRAHLHLNVEREARQPGNSR